MPFVKPRVSRATFSICHGQTHMAYAAALIRAGCRAMENMMKRPQHMLACAALLLLAGCTTTAERAQQASQEMERTMQTFGPACERLGFQPNTNQWRDCVLRLSEKDEMARYGYYGSTFPGPWPRRRF